MTNSLPFKRVARLVYGNSLPAELRVDGPYPVYGSGGAAGTHIVKNFEAPGIIVGRKGSYGAVHWAPNGGFAIDTAYYIDRRTSNADLRWLYYVLQAVDLRGVSQDVGIPGLSREVAHGTRIPNPPAREEQRKVVEFLDSETAKLAAMVEAQERLYRVLNERIDCQILQIIGNSALGDPVNGSLPVPMRRVLVKVARPAVNPPDVITAFRDGQVTARSLRRAEGYTNPASVELQGQHVLVDDIVVHGLDGFSGAIGNSEAEGNCSPVYHVLVPIRGGDPLYYGRLLRILALQEYLTGFSYSTRERAFDFRNWDMFGRIPLPVADLQRQRAIGEQIRKLRPLSAKIGKFAEIAAERRQAVITAAVTGQFDVSTASGRGIEE